MRHLPVFPGISPSAKFAEIELDCQRQLLETIIQILPCRIFARNTEGKFLLINEEHRNTFHIDARENGDRQEINGLKGQ